MGTFDLLQPPPAAPTSRAIARLDAVYRAVRNFLEPEGSNRQDPNPNDPAWHPELVRAWHYAHGRRQRRRAVLLMNPNAGSAVKAEAFVFSLSPTTFMRGSGLRWGELNHWIARKSPREAFQAERLYVNVKASGVANIDAIEGSGWPRGSERALPAWPVDAFSFSPLAVNNTLKLPTIAPNDHLEVRGLWSGSREAARLSGVTFPEPPKRSKRKGDAEEPGPEFKLCLDFQGWATIHCKNEGPMSALPQPAIGCPPPPRTVLA